MFVFSVPEMVQCYATFHPSDGTCGNVLGEVSLDECCMNPSYGYQDKKNECKSCRYSGFLPWSKDMHSHGGWSAWGGWGACSGTCEIEGILIHQEQRTRTCTNPPPSISPRGNYCSGSSTDTRHCTGLPFCPVNGNWGAWSAASDCSVTCGVGLQTQHRDCDNPAPKYGGQYCPGDNSRTSVCTVPKNCPANGQWTEWSEWTDCVSPNQRSITCRNRLGRRRRLRDCVGREYDGDFCDGQGVEFSSCYDIEGCEVGAANQIPRALWSEWSDWSYCKPDCGEDSVQARKRECIPDISKYSEPRLQIFSGKPNIICQPLEDTNQTRPCLNLPPC
ncbi:hypothetical protein QTP70_019573 [Hemibagrus guttatus]|uniref:Properdin n=1 Tax=Hemibagrus guttatus TaxID=175788 RepID=A0AAE0R297_9TELE|nr:hypothetical protein QTP70_019573 [Hemibagrus guttatus]